MPRPKALILSAKGRLSFTAKQRKLIESKLVPTYKVRLRPLNPEKFSSLAKSYQVIGITRRALASVDSAVLERLPLLRGLAVYATGLDWIDLKACKARGVRILGLPDYSARSVAEHALACLLALSRRLHLSHDRARGLAPATVSLRGWELKGKKLGIIGLGKIGSQVSALGRSVGMSVGYCDPRKSTGKSLKALLASSDAVVLAASRAFGDPPLLGRAELAWMRKQAVLVNVARSAMVDSKAVLASLRRGQLAGYAVDDAVPALLKARGLEPGRLLHTAHTGWYSNEAMAKGAQQWAEALAKLGR